MIDVRELTKHFGRFVALDSVGVHVARGESVALWGPNGAGKTTLLRCVLGLYRYEGTVCIAGLDARSQGRAARALLGHVPQRLAFAAERTTGEVLGLIARLRGVPPRQARVLLERVGLADRVRQPVGALSGGMQQKLALAAALVGNPPALLLDEPTANLDVAARAELVELLGELRRAGKTLLLTTHRLDEVERLADRVVILERGRVRRTCRAHELAAAVGMHTRVVMWVAADAVQAARAALSENGLEAVVHGDVVEVEVLPSERLRPLAALAAAGVTVRDANFEDVAVSSKQS